jgi:hypothetical protein
MIFVICSETHPTTKRHAEMKTLFGILRIFAMALVAALLLNAGEMDSAASSPNQPSTSIATTPTSGAALFLGAYGFLIMLRRRSLR